MIFFKIVISGIIVLITTYIGNQKARNLKKREYILREMVTFLNLVKDEIRYCLSILPNAYESSRQKLSTCLKDAIGGIVMDMINYDNVDLIDKSIVDNISNIDELSNYDKSIIISTLKNLGRSDLESQVNIINNTINILENQINEANERKLKETKMYRTVGMITGIMIVIIFI